MLQIRDNAKGEGFGFDVWGNFALECGKISTNLEIIDKYGFVWCGKFGNHLSGTVTKALLKEEESCTLLIYSETTN